MKKIALILAAALASSCVSVLPQADPASARFLLSAVEPGSEAGESVGWTLGVDEPKSTLAFSTAKIALTREPGRIEYYAGGEWADRAPRLFHSALVQSFENTGRIRGVGDRLTLPIADYVLQTDLRNFAVRHENGAVIGEVAVFARITNGRSQIHASRLFRADETAAADSAAGAAAALNTALSTVEREIVEWTFSSVAGREAEKSGS